MSSTPSIAAFSAAALLTACGAARPHTTPPERTTAAPADVVILAEPETAERHSLASEGRVRDVPPIETAASRVAPLFEQARAHAVRFEHAEALAKIGEAQVLLESEASAPADWAALHRALCYRGLFESNLGRDDRARAALAAAALLDPDATLSDVEFPPDIVALYREVATEVRAEPPAALAVTTEPAGATVFIDGEAAGQSPITLHAAPGQHYLSFDAFGHAHRNLTVEIAAAGNAPLDVELPAAGESALARQVLRIDDAALAAMPDDTLRLLRERFVTDVLVRVQGSGAALALRLSDGAVSAGSVSTGRGTIATIVAGLPAPEESTGEGAASVGEGEEEGGSFLASPWFWVAVGVVVLGGAAAGITVAATRDPEPVLRASSVE